MRGKAIRGALATLAILAGVAVLGSELVAVPVAHAGVKKKLKKARKKTRKAASKTKKAVVSTARKATASAEQLWHSWHKDFKSGEETPAFPKGAFARFRPHAQLDWVNAYLLALASKVAYYDRGDAKRLMADLGLPEFTWINQRNVEAFVASDARIVVVALRGTEFHSFKDAFTDLDMYSVKLYGGKAHKGTHRAVSHIWPELLAAVKKHNPSGAKALWVTGHSLGGNMSLLVGKRLVASGLRVESIYNYGQFKVGNRIFDRNFKIPLHRFVNENDPVPYGPAVFKVGNKKSYYFVHTGSMHFIDKKGRYRPEKRRLPPAEKDPMRLYKIITGGISQHLIDRYLTQTYKQLPDDLKKEWPAPF